MATAARKVSVTARDAVSDSFVHNVGFKVVYANAAAGDITQLSTNGVLLVVDADSTSARDRQKVIAMAEAAVYELKRQMMAKDKPSAMSTSTITSYRPR